MTASVTPTSRRATYLLDLLSEDRRASYDQAARRNGLKLSVWLREVADAAAERTPAPAVPADVVLDPEPVVAVPHEHVPKRTPWGGRVCEGCGDLL